MSLMSKVKRAFVFVFGGWGGGGLPQVSHGFSADQREDDVVVLLTLEPVDRRHLRGHTNTHRNIKAMLTKLCVCILGSCRDLAEMFNRERVCLKFFFFFFYFGG